MLNKLMDDMLGSTDESDYDSDSDLGSDEIIEWNREVEEDYDEELEVLCDEEEDSDCDSDTDEEEEMDSKDGIVLILSPIEDNIDSKEISKPITNPIATTDRLPEERPWLVPNRPTARRGGKVSIAVPKDLSEEQVDDYYREYYDMNRYLSNRLSDRRPAIPSTANRTTTREDVQNRLLSRAQAMDDMIRADLLGSRGGYVDSNRFVFGPQSRDKLYDSDLI